jgi:hypothetical protein
MRHPIERKSSKPRVRSASVAGSAPNFILSENRRRHIEWAYGRKFNEQDRCELRAIVDKFLDWRRFEKAAPLVEDVTCSIMDIEKAARGLNRALSRLFDRNGPDPEATFQAEIAIEQAWPGSNGLISKQLPTVLSSGCALALACTKARKALVQDGAGWEGQAWELMIQRLLDFASNRKLSTSIRKDSARQAQVKHSPFVQFVKALQEQFPPGTPIRFSTEDSLARAIGQVRRQAKERGINFGQCATE